jgi:hypothetical protein
VNDVPGRVPELAQEPASGHDNHPPYRLSGNREHRSPAADSMELGERAIWVDNMLENLEGDDKVDRLVRYREMDGVGEHQWDWKFPPGLGELDEGQVQADDAGRREALLQPCRDPALTGADLEHDLGLEPSHESVERTEESLHHPFLGRVGRGVLVVEVPGDIRVVRCLHAV